MSQSGSLSSSQGTLPSDVLTTIVGNVGSGSAVSNIFDIVGTGGVSTSVLGNVLTISVSSTGFTWQIVTSTSPLNPIQIIPENGYSCQGSSLVTFILPLSPTLGDSFIIASTTSRFQINQNGGQQMMIGLSTTTIGVTGYCISNSQGDYIEFVYMGNNVFQSFSPQGTITTF
jgi:hypothetical protein